MLDDFNVKKFLSLPLNNGGRFYAEDLSCGCVKGNFKVASGTSMSKHMDGDIFYMSKDLESLFRREVGLEKILYCAERLLIQTRNAAKTKMFTIRALRKYGYIPKDTEIPTIKELDHAIQM